MELEAHRVWKSMYNSELPQNIAIFSIHWGLVPRYYVETKSADAQVPYIKQCGSIYISTFYIHTADLQPLLKTMRVLNKKHP